MEIKWESREDGNLLTFDSPVVVVMHSPVVMFLHFSLYKYTVTDVTLTADCTTD